MRTALVVGRFGTVRAAAEAMGVHRSTVTRHVDTLEEALGAKLFIRHKEGYTLTGYGQAMLEVANRAEHLFSKFAESVARDDGELKGVLTISSLTRAAPVIAPAILRFYRQHPKVTIRFEIETRLARLEKNEAQIAIRAGPKPTDPDYVVMPLQKFRIGLYGHKNYLEEMGVPKSNEDLAHHRFVGLLRGDAPYEFERELARYVAAERVVLETVDPLVVLYNVLSGLGLGYISAVDAERCTDLIEVLPRDEPWMANVWVVTHVDLHRTRLVQEFLSCLRLESY